jgi:hypothetical protein
MRRALGWFAFIAAFAMLAGAGCHSSPGAVSSAQDAACTPADATVASSLSADGGACNACILSSCQTDLSLCSSECVCNDMALGALACLEDLGGNASIAAVTSCVSPLANASEPQLSELGGCVLTSCVDACGGGSRDSGACDAVGTRLTALLDAGSSPCESCLQTSCQGAIATCSASCDCNASAVTVLECLADLGDATSLGSASACLGPLQAAVINTPLAGVGACLVGTCGAVCGAASDAGSDASSSPGDAATGADVTVTGAPDGGSDGGCVMCSGGCCQQMEVTSTSAPPTSLWLDVSTITSTSTATLYWTANEPTLDGGANGEILSEAVPPDSVGVFTLYTGAGHTFGAIVGSPTALYFVDQSAGNVLTMPKQYTTTPSVVVGGAVSGVAIQSTAADGGAGVNVYFGGASSVGWVSFPGPGATTDSMNLAALQLTVDTTNVYAVGTQGAAECPFGASSGSSSTFTTGTMGALALTHGQGIFADQNGNVWMTDQGDPNVPDGAIYKCSSTSGICATFVSGRNQPYAIVADNTSVYWTEAYDEGAIVRCPVASCPNGPEAIAHAFETPTALVQDATNLYWADVNNISTIVK